MYIQSRQLQSPFPSLWHIQPSPLGRIFRGWFSAASLCFHLDCLYVGFLVDESFAWSGNLEKFLRGSTVFLILFFFLFTFLRRGLVVKLPVRFPCFYCSHSTQLQIRRPSRRQRTAKAAKRGSKIMITGCPVLSCPVRLSVCACVYCICVRLRAKDKG